MSDFGILHKATAAISAAPDLFTSDKLVNAPSAKADGFWCNARAIAPR